MIFSSIKGSKVDAKTFGELKQELTDEEEALEENQQSKQLTEEQMTTINNKIASTQSSIQKTYRDIENLTAEIESLNKSIEEKEAQIKEIINFSQISSGDSAYLEYVFNAQDFTDFIYRSAVAEQLANYNNKLIEEFNQDIENNKKKQKEIEEKRVTLTKQQKELEEQYDNLGTQLSEIVDVSMDIKDQISYLKDMVALYKERGCKDEEDIKTCGRSVLPSNTKFYRPLVQGFATSEYSTNRVGTFSGFHSGLDQSVSPNTNVKVYASGTGVVSGIVYKSSCGGTYVLIHHKMTNGDTYTTMYMHLAKALVSKGDTVTKDTVIGIMGGGHNSSTPSNYTPWDTCTTGPHLHFTIATGLYGIDYTTWSAFMSHTFNPRNIVNYPSGRYNWFTDRLTKY
jgi:peptidoglycan hydrolase CwlO-like protein